MKSFKIFTAIALFLSFTLLVACEPDDNGSDVPGGKENPPASLKKASPYPFGAALSITKMKNSNAYSTTVKNEFNSITAENAMKMVNLAPAAKDQYVWADADYLVNFAQDNGMRIHGHCLVWHNSLPNWVNNFSGSKEEWKTLLRNYITTVVTRYKGKIASWDVVNEILTDDGKPRSSVWLTKIGWEYVDLAFRAAHEADPDAVLFYNEYGQEYSSVKLTAINDTVNNMIARGVPIHGVGLQMHTNINQSAESMVHAITETAKTGLKIHVSELDVALNQAKKADYVINATDLNTQKSRYRAVAAAMCHIPASQWWGITTWGVGDTDSWLKDNPDFPLIFDNSYQRKSCYDGLLEAFAAK
jgi:endo-1,4-beta-xylanase